MHPNLLLALLISLLLTRPAGATEGVGTANAALRDLEDFTLEAVVDGPEVLMLVTEADIETEMAETLTQAGIWNDRVGDSGGGGGHLQLVFKSYAVEPVLPEAHDQPVQVFPISVYLAVSRPVYLKSDGGTIEVRAQVWWTHVEAWALQRTMHAVACIAIHHALDQFIEAHAAARQPARAPALPAPAVN